MKIQVIFIIHILQENYWINYKEVKQVGKKIYLIRHCEATGQAPEAELTGRGKGQAEELAEHLKDESITRIISSPYLRAIQSIAPFSALKEIEIETDDRLVERKLSEGDLPDWLQKLENSFEDLDLKFNGGESSNEAMKRATQVINNISEDEDNIATVVTHGNLLTLILKHFNDEIGFEHWKNLRNPHVWLLDFSDKVVQIKQF